MKWYEYNVCMYSLFISVQRWQKGLFVSFSSTGSEKVREGYMYLEEKDMPPLALAVSCRLFLAVLKRWLGCYFNLPIDIALFRAASHRRLTLPFVGWLLVLLPLFLVKDEGAAALSAYLAVTPNENPSPNRRGWPESTRSSTRLGLNYA